jgi:hypothetical protein
LDKGKERESLLKGIKKYWANDDADVDPVFRILIGG